MAMNRCGAPTCFQSSERNRRQCVGSTHELSRGDNLQIWAEEADRRAAAMKAGRLPVRSADAVFRDARARV